MLSNVVFFACLVNGFSNISYLFCFFQKMQSKYSMQSKDAKKIHQAPTEAKTSQR